MGVGDFDAGGGRGVVEEGAAVGDALALVVAIDDRSPGGLVVARLQDGDSALGAGLGDGSGGTGDRHGGYIGRNG